MAQSCFKNENDGVKKFMDSKIKDVSHVGQRKLGKGLWKKTARSNNYTRKMYCGPQKMKTVN